MTSTSASTPAATRPQNQPPPPPPTEPGEHRRFLTVLLRHLTAVHAVEQIPADRALRMLGLNSMRAVDLVIDLEDEFGFQFPDAAFTDETFETAASLWGVVAGLTEPAVP